MPAILVAFFSVLWVKGFGPEDRELFRLRKNDVRELRMERDVLKRSVVLWVKEATK